MEYLKKDDCSSLFFICCGGPFQKLNSLQQIYKFTHLYILFKVKNLSSLILLVIFG